MQCVVNLLSCEIESWNFMTLKQNTLDFFHFLKRFQRYVKAKKL